MPRAPLRRYGVMFQGGALFSSMTLAENVALPLGEYTDRSASEMRELACLATAFAKSWNELLAVLEKKSAVLRKTG